MQRCVVRDKRRTCQNGTREERGERSGRLLHSRSCTARGRVVVMERKRQYFRSCFLVEAKSRTYQHACPTRRQPLLLYVNTTYGVGLGLSGTTLVPIQELGNTKTDAKPSFIASTPTSHLSIGGHTLVEVCRINPSTHQPTSLMPAHQPTELNAAPNLHLCCVGLVCGQGLG